MLTISSALEMALPFSATLPACMCNRAVRIAAWTPSNSITINWWGEADMTPLSTPTLA